MMGSRATWVFWAVIVIFAAGFSQTQENADPRALDQFIKGNVAAQQGNPYQAIYCFDEALRYDATAPFLYVALAEQYLILAQEDETGVSIERAEKNLGKALELDPHHIPALELKSRLLAAKGMVVQAKDALKSLCKLDSTNIGYQAELLGLCLTSGDFEEVDSLYGILAAHSDEENELARRIVAVYLITGQSARALPYMQIIAQADTTDAAVIYTLATLYLQTEDTAQATRYGDRAIELDSTDARYWYLKLVIEFDHERFENVLKIAARARQAAGDDARSANLEGLSYMRLADSTRAMERFTRALELDSTLYPSAGSLALLYDAEGNFEQSEKYYEIAIELSDSAAIYLNNCAYMYAVRSLELDKAMEMVDAALEREPDNSSYLDTKGWIYFQQGEYKNALKWIKKALKIDEQNAPVLEHLGDVHFAMGRTARAKSAWSDALKIDPNNDVLKEKLAR
jgi:tetratricopeptide (TPR) repeat protein